MVTFAGQEDVADVNEVWVLSYTFQASATQTMTTGTTGDNSSSNDYSQSVAGYLFGAGLIVVFVAIVLTLAVVFRYQSR